MNPYGAYESEAAGPPTCRLCLETARQRDMIVPCQCKGSLLYVHRDCLDTWRAVSSKKSSFSQCDLCRANYDIVEVLEEAPCWRVKLAMLISRDICTAFILLNVLILAIGAIGYGMFRPSSELIDRFSVTRWMSTNWRHSTVVFVLMYCMGGLLLLFLTGLASLFWGGYVMLNQCCGDGSVSLTSPCGGGRARRDPNAPPTYDEATSYPYRSSNSSCNCTGCYWIYCGPNYNSSPCVCDCCCDDPSYRSSRGSGSSGSDCNCNCGGGNCGGGNCGGGGGSSSNDGAGLIAILLVVVIAIIVLGLIVGIFLFSAFVVSVVNRHLAVVNRRFKAKRFYVRDLASPNARPGTFGPAPTAAAAAAINDDETSPLVKAPPPTFAD